MWNKRAHDVGLMGDASLVLFKLIETYVFQMGHGSLTGKGGDLISVIGSGKGLVGAFNIMAMGQGS